MKFNVEKISKILTDKGAINPCHRCNANEFVILNGYSMLGLQDNLNGIVIGGNSVPMVNVVCTRCGAVTSHVAGALGLLDNKVEQ